MEPLRELIQVQSNLQFVQEDKEKTSIDSVPSELIQIIFPKVEDFNSSMRVGKRWNVYLTPLALQKEFVKLKNIYFDDITKGTNLEILSRRFADIGKMDKALEVARFIGNIYGCLASLPNTPFISSCFGFKTSNKGRAFAYIIHKLLANKQSEEAIKIADSWPMGMDEDKCFEIAAYVFSNHQLPDQVDLMIHKISQEYIRNRTIKSLAIRQENIGLSDSEINRKLNVVFFESENPGYGEKIVTGFAKIQLYETIGKLRHYFNFPKDFTERYLLKELMEQIDKSEKMEESEITMIMSQLMLMLIKRNPSNKIKFH